MAGKSDFLESAYLNYQFGQTLYTPSATAYMALYSTAPTDAGGGTEFSLNGYARASVVNSTAMWPPAVTGAKTNASAIQFPTATGDWGTATAFGLFDALANGNLLYWANLATAKVCASGDIPYFASGSVQIVED